MQRSRLLVLLLVIALAVRLAALPVGLRQAAARGLDYFDEYGGIARNIVEGRGFSYHWYGETHPTSIHAPLYPYILAGFFSLFGFERGGTLAVLLFNILLSILFLYLVFRCAERLFGVLPGLVALAILAIYPSQVYYAASGLPGGGDHDRHVLEHQQLVAGVDGRLGSRDLVGARREVELLRSGGPRRRPGPGGRRRWEVFPPCRDRR